MGSQARGSDEAAVRVSSETHDRETLPISYTSQSAPQISEPSTAVYTIDFQEQHTRVQKERKGRVRSVGSLPLQVDGGADMSSTTRPRSRRAPQNESHSSADESAPIIWNAQGPGSGSGTKSGGRRSAADYQSISPEITARTTGVEGTRAEPGDDADRIRESQRREEISAQSGARIPRDRERSRWSKMLERYSSVELDNKGSVARDHLALERTFLAWLRTSLSFASIGIAITQLFRLNTTISSQNPDIESSPQTRLRHVGKPLGATFVAVAVLILLIGFHRYFEAQHYVIRGKFPASRGSILVVAGVAAALIVSSLIVILAVAPGAFER